MIVVGPARPAVEAPTDRLKCARFTHSRKSVHLSRLYRLRCTLLAGARSSVVSSRLAAPGWPRTGGPSPGRTDSGHDRLDGPRETLDAVFVGLNGCTGIDEAVEVSEHLAQHKERSAFRNRAAEGERER